MIGVEPVRFAAVCKSCGAREEPLHGTRAEVIDLLVRRSWRIADEAKTMTCADCAGPPSVFPTATLTNTGGCCTACRAEVDVCAACETQLGTTDVISCRREHGHTHARCSTQKLAKLARRAE